MRLQRAFTLVEVMVVVAVAAIIALIAAPSFRDMILMQRLKSINAQLVTDLQFARSEAVARNVPMQVLFETNPGALTCYSIFTAPNDNVVCSCKRGAGNACTVLGTVEVRTVQVPQSLAVKFTYPWDGFAFDPTTGGVRIVSADEAIAPPIDFVVDTEIDSARNLRVVLNRAGRLSVCAPTGSKVSVPACPAPPP